MGNIWEIYSNLCLFPHDLLSRLPTFEKRRGRDFFTIIQLQFLISIFVTVSFTILVNLWSKLCLLRLLIYDVSIARSTLFRTADWLVCWNVLMIPFSNAPSSLAHTWPNVLPVCWPIEERLQVIFGSLVERKIKWKCFHNAPLQLPLRVTDKITDILNCR